MEGKERQEEGFSHMWFGGNGREEGMGRDPFPSRPTIWLPLNFQKKRVGMKI